MNNSGKRETRIITHRSVYRFGGQMTRTLLAAVPWINFLIILLLLMVVHGHLMIVPGMVFELPEAPLRGGSRVGLTALMIAVTRGSGDGEETLVFFDDDRYVIQDEAQVAVLKERLKSHMIRSTSRELLLMADKRIAHGDVLKFIHTARESGVLRVNVAEKPE